MSRFNSTTTKSKLILPQCKNLQGWNLMSTSRVANINILFIYLQSDKFSLLWEKSFIKPLQYLSCCNNLWEDALARCQSFSSTYTKHLHRSFISLKYWGANSYRNSSYSHTSVSIGRVASWHAKRPPKLQLVLFVSHYYQINIIPFEQ